MPRPRDTVPGRLWNVLVPIALMLTGVGWLALGLGLGVRAKVAAAYWYNMPRHCGNQRMRDLWKVVTDNSGPWIPHPTNGSSYWRISARTWDDTQRLANRHGAHLVGIDSAAEQDWLVAQFGGRELFWIGLRDVGSEGVWRLDTGSPMTYTNWADEEPNSMYEHGEHFDVMNWRTPGKWNDMSASSGRASNVRAAILERPSRPMADASPRGRGPDVQGSSVIPVVR